MGVCAWARVTATPCHSWLGCWGVCVFVRPLRLYPATPRWGVRRGFVCLGFRFWLRPATPGWGVGVYACLCARSACTPPVLVRVCVLGLGFRLRLATRGWGVGVCVCSCARSTCTPPLVAGGCGVGVCAWARVSAAPRHSWLGCWGLCVFVCALRLYSASPGSGVCAWARVSAAPRHSWLGCWGVCVSCAPSACTPPLPAGGCGVGVCACARISAAARHSPQGPWGVCVLVCALRLFPATPGWGVRRGCVCLGSCFGCAPPLLAGMLRCVCVCVPASLVPRHSWLPCVVWVCVWTRVSAPPRHSWLGCLGVCVFVCVLRLYPPTPGWGVRCGCVCLGSGLGCASPLLAGVLGCVCVFVSALRLYPATPGWGMRRGCVCLGSGFGCPCHSWLGCWGVCVFMCPLHLYPATPGWGVWCVCMLGLGLRLRPASPGWGVGVCVRLCARSACTPPLLAGVCSLGVCAWARVLAAPRHSWLGCWGVCGFVCVLRLYPAAPGWGVGRVCGCLGSGFSCAPPVPAGVFGCLFVFVPAPLVPRHSWPGCAVWLWVLGLGFGLRSATPCWGVGVCVCSCARSACTPRLLAGVCGVVVCAWARVSAATRHSWLGCWGVCVFVCALRLYPATPGCRLWSVRWVLPETCSCAVVPCVLCALPGFAAPGGRCCLAPAHVPSLWPAACLSDVPRGPVLVPRA